MKNNKQDFAVLMSIFILSMTFFYLCISFALWDLNASHWEVSVRAMYAIFGTAFSAIITTAATKFI